MDASYTGFIRISSLKQANQKIFSGKAEWSFYYRLIEVRFADRRSGYPGSRLCEVTFFDRPEKIRRLYLRILKNG